jgi:hypothetical protein
MSHLKIELFSCLVVQILLKDNFSIAFLTQDQGGHSCKFVKHEATQHSKIKTIKQETFKRLTIQT